VLTSQIEGNASLVPQPIQRTRSHDSVTASPESHSESEDCQDESIETGAENPPTNLVQQKDRATTSQESKNGTNEEECEEDQANVEGQSEAIDHNIGSLDVNTSTNKSDVEYSSRAAKRLGGRPKKPRPSPTRPAPKTRPPSFTKRATSKPASTGHPVAKSPTNKTQSPVKQDIRRPWDTGIADLFRPKAKLDEGDGSTEGAGFPGCGKAPLNELTKGYIKRGQIVEYGEFPQFADLKIEISGRMCSGVLISDREVLTTADCMKKVNRRDTEGAWTTVFGQGPTTVKGPNEVVRAGGRVCLSQKNRNDGRRFNWAIISFIKPVKFTDHIQPACLPRPKQKIDTYGPSSSCYLISSGEVDSSLSIGWVNVHLAENVTKMRVENVACKKEFGDIDEDRVCYKGVNSESGTCKGDLGGPVLCLDWNRKWTLMGLLSYGPDSCIGEPPSPTVFTRIRTMLADMYDQCGAISAMPKRLGRAPIKDPKPDPSFGPPAKLDEGRRSMDGGGFPQCGKAPLSEFTKGYLIEGDHIKYGEFPQYVHLYIRDLEGELRPCGGTLVSDRHVLTAAHCFFDGDQLLDPKKARVVFAEDYLNRTDKEEFSIGINKICISDKTMPGNLRFDWALLFLKTPVLFNDYIQPACLPRPDQKVTTYGPNSVCFVVGAGAIGIYWEGNEKIYMSTEFVRKIRVENIACTGRETGRIDVDRVCYAGANNSASDSCRGDSGGPVLCLDEKKRWTLMGMVSYGPPNCDDPTRSVYGRVRNFLHKIRELCNVDLLR